MYNPGNNMLFSDGRIDVSAVMKAAHIKARRDMEGFRASRLYDEAAAKYWTYARYFKEAIQWAWDRARQMKRLALFWSGNVQS